MPNNVIVHSSKQKMLLNDRKKHRSLLMIESVLKNYCHATFSGDQQNKQHHSIQKKRQKIRQYSACCLAVVIILLSGSTVRFWTVWSRIQPYNPNQNTNDGSSTTAKKNKRLSSPSSNTKSYSNHNNKTSKQQEYKIKQQQRGRHHVTPFDSYPPDPIPFADDITTFINDNTTTKTNHHSFYDVGYAKMIHNRHICIQYIRTKHDTILEPYLQPVDLKTTSSNDPTSTLTTSKEIKPLWDEILLVDPAYHENVGDHMITVSEIKYITDRMIGTSSTSTMKDLNSSSNTLGNVPQLKQCSYIQARNYVESCRDMFHKILSQQQQQQQKQIMDQHNHANNVKTQIDNNDYNTKNDCDHFIIVTNDDDHVNPLIPKRKIAIWHGGGNWGNLWKSVQKVRIESFRTLLNMNYDRIVSMPQSLYYHHIIDKSKQYDDTLKATTRSTTTTTTTATCAEIKDCNTDTKNITINIAAGLNLFSSSSLFSSSKGTILDQQDTQVTKEEYEKARALLLLKNNTTSKERIIFTWRERTSYNQALELYPFATNLLIPDIAFQLGPYDGRRLFFQQQQQSTTSSTRSSNKQTQVFSSSPPMTDIVFLLRNDHESLYLHERNRISIQTYIDQYKNIDTNKNQLHEKTYAHRRILLHDNSPNSRNSGRRKQQRKRRITFSIVDWIDRSERFHSSDIFFTETAVQLVSSGHIIITDRLHASILAYVSGIPFVYLDSISNKINNTFDVAFDGSRTCQNTIVGMYNKATNVSNAVQLAIQFLHEQKFV